MTEGNIAMMALMSVDPVPAGVTCSACRVAEIKLQLHLGPGGRERGEAITDITANIHTPSCLSAFSYCHSGGTLHKPKWGSGLVYLKTYEIFVFEMLLQ